MSEKLTISEKELLSKKLTQEIEELKATRNNLETQINTLERQKKATQNVDEAKQQEVRNKALTALSDAREAVLKEKNEYHRRNEMLIEQQQMMEKNEKEMGDVKVELQKIQDERMEIYSLRREANSLMDKAKEQWGEIDGFKESQEAMKQNLKSQIELNKDKNKYLMDLIGDVEKREKAVKVREANCRALEMKFDKKKEVVNV